MPDEINSLSIAISGNDRNPSKFANVSFLDRAVGDLTGAYQTIGTSSETIDLGNVSDPPFVFIKNLDSTNFVHIDSVSTMDAFPQKILPGRSIVISPESPVLYAKADTAPVKIWAAAAD